MLLWSNAMKSKDGTKLILEIINKFCIKQEQLAQKVEVTLSTIHNWVKKSLINNSFLFLLLVMLEKAGLKNIGYI